MNRVPAYSDASQRWGLLEGDALELLARLPEDSLDAIVTDPPYGIGFRAEAWDGPDIQRAAACEGELPSPGVALSAWTTQWARQCQRVLKPGGHLLAFGAPRTFHRLTSGIEDAGLEIRDVVLWLHAQGAPKSPKLPGGLGTQFKPAYEPVLVARKPLAEATTQRNVEAWGTGALNIASVHSGEFWPAPLAFSHAPGCSEGCCAPGCPGDLLDQMRPDLRPSRLCFCAKASKAEREAGCEALPLRNDLLYSRPAPRLRRNIHPTVKPLELMRWLVRLVVPAGGLVLDPFAGSGSTGVAAVMEGHTFLGLEREGDYVDIAGARLHHWAAIAAQERGTAMTDSAVPSSEQHQRKEVRRKEITMLTKRKREADDWKVPRTWRAAIYLREPDEGEKNQTGRVPSIHGQGVICRCVATVLHAEVVGEFVDWRFASLTRPGFNAVLELARRDQRLDYLIVSSWDRLACDYAEAFHIGWQLGFEGTVTIPADAEGEFPWTGQLPHS